MVAAEIQAHKQGPGVPHFDEIELPAYALGKEFSRMIQSERMRSVATSRLKDPASPGRESPCAVEVQSRHEPSVDGPHRIRRGGAAGVEQLGLERGGLERRCWRETR